MTDPAPESRDEDRRPPEGDDGIPIGRGAVLFRGELEYEYSRSQGPGGQHVNKSNTRVSACWPLEEARGLEDRHRRLIRRSLKKRLDAEGRLRVTSQSQRSQKRNRDAAVERMVELLREVLAPRRFRVATRIPPREKRHRRENKRRRSDRKRQRSGRYSRDD